MSGHFFSINTQMYRIYFIVQQVMGFLTEKVKEKPDPNSKTAIDFDSKVTAERDKQIKVIVPNSTAGMIIGKGGSYIKHLKETSGSFIQLSQKAKDNTLPERVVTIIGACRYILISSILTNLMSGDESSNEVALKMILSKIQEDPQSGSCLNISYSDMTGACQSCRTNCHHCASATCSECFKIIFQDLWRIAIQLGRLLPMELRFRQINHALNYISLIPG